MKTITLEDMVLALQKPGCDIHDSMTAAKCNLMHHGYGIAGEMLEIDTALYNNDEDNFIEEAGDAIFYLEGVMLATGMQSVEYLIEDPQPFDIKFDTLAQAADAIVDTVKKHVIYGRELDLTAIENGAMSLLHHLAIHLDSFDSSLLQCVAANKEKLSVRYEGFKYSDKAANDRKDKNA